MSSRSGLRVFLSSFRNSLFLLPLAALFAILSFAPSVAADAATSDRDLELVTKYVDATHVQQEALKGVQMDMEVDAKLPRLSKQGTLMALRKISKLGQITYKALGFSGDSTIKQEVIARYLAAESEARDNGSIAITPTNYKFRYAGKNVTNGKIVQVFELTPRTKRVGLFKGELWIDNATAMPVRESGVFVKTPSVFLKKIAFVRDYELKDGVALPKHIASTVDTRLVGRAELQIAFSNFSKQPAQDQQDPADGQAATPGQASAVDHADSVTGAVSGNDTGTATVVAYPVPQAPASPVPASADPD
jgi:hypothetical protein